MSWLLDQTPDLDDEALRPTDDEVKALKDAQEARANGSGDGRRSAADAVLDAVVGKTPTAASSKKCPTCGGNTKTRNATVGMTTVARVCRNKACSAHGIEVPVASVKSRVALPPTFPDPMIHGGPYPVGPNRGGSSAPPIDHNQPVQRRLSEFTRRISADGE
jgi:hypothetical protein